jgi:hypothetical protein
MQASTLIKKEAMIKINWGRSANDIPLDLWEKAFPKNVERLWWYSVLERSKLEDQFEFYYGILIEDEKPIGIIPAFVNNVPIELVAPDAIASVLRLVSKVIPACGYQRTLFVGSPCSDEGTIGLLPQYSLAQFVQHIHDAVYKHAEKIKAPMIVWKDFPKAAEPALDELCKNTPVFKMTSYPGTILYLKEPNMESYLKGLKSSRRHNFLKNLRRGKEFCPTDALVIQKPNAETLDEIFALFWQTYENGKTKFERLTKEFFIQIAQLECSRFIVLRQPNGGKAVAFMLCFLVENKVINKFIGLDYNIARDARLYFQLWQAVLELTISVGAKSLQSGQTGYRFKIDTGSDLEPLFNYCQNRNPLINLIFAKVSSTISWSSLDEDLKKFLEAHPEAELKAQQTESIK